MSAVAASTSNGRGGAGRGIDFTGAFPGIIALAACGVYATTLPPVSDHGWQFYMAERMLDGARLYIDVGAADMHPPLFTWLAALIAAVGRVIGVDGLWLFPVVVFAATAGSIVAWWRITGSSGWMLAVVTLALVAMAGPYFGQGEHLALVLSLPYLAAAAMPERARGRTGALLIGLAAGVGLAMKPHFALVWVGIELWLAVRRGPRSLLRTESVTIGLVFVAYVVATLLLTPTLFTLVPWLAKLYPRYAPRAFMDVLLDRRALLLAAGLAAMFATRRDRGLTALSRVLAIAAVAMYAALLLQGKGWGYHWYPVNALAVMLIGLAAAPWLASYRIASPVMAILAVLLMQRQSDRTYNLLIKDPVYLPELVEVVEKHAQGGSILALSHLLQTGFPLVNMTGTQWASPYAHLWMVPAMYSDSRGYRLPNAYRDTGEWKQIEQDMFDRLWEAIERSDPRIIILHAPLASAFDMRAYFETDERFRARFARSPVIGTVGRYIILGPPAPDCVPELPPDPLACAQAE